MEDCREQGLLQLAFYNEKPLGLIAAERSDFLGTQAIYFNEILIYPEFKGRGLAKAMQRKFISELPDDFKLVWGTIDAQNFPSLKTAMSNGRKVIRYECFLNT